MTRTRILKRTFYAEGALSNPALFRRMRSGAWAYWRLNRS